MLDLSDPDTLMVCAHAGVSTLGLLRMGDSVTCKAPTKPEWYKLQRAEHFVFTPSFDNPRSMQMFVPWCKCNA